MQYFNSAIKQLTKEADWFHNHVKKGYTNIMPLEYQKTSTNSIPGLYNNYGNSEISEHIAITRELLYQLQDLIRLPDTHLELYMRGDSGNVFLTLKNTKYDAVITVFGLSSFNQLYNYANSYFFECEEHEWDILRKEEYYSVCSFSGQKNMIDKGTNGLFLLSKEFNINMKATCEGHPHNAYIYFENNNENSLKLSQIIENISNWKKTFPSGSHFTMKNVTEEERRETWRKTWDILKQEFKYELPDDVKNRIQITNNFKI